MHSEYRKKKFLSDKNNHVTKVMRHKRDGAETECSTNEVQEKTQTYEKKKMELQSKGITNAWKLSQTESQPGSVILSLGGGKTCAVPSRVSTFCGTHPKPKHQKALRSMMSTV